MTETVSRRACERIRAEMQRLALNQADLAGLIGWTQSKISKVLNGETDLSVDDLEALCFGVGLRISEAVRDHGLEFCAEMTPQEFRVLEELRRRHGTLDGLMQLLRISAPDAPRALPIKRRPRKASNG
jgi:transcriptional regulator with XRE-family HTH domain